MTMYKVLENGEPVKGLQKVEVFGVCQTAFRPRSIDEAIKYMIELEENVYFVRWDNGCEELITIWEDSYKILYDNYSGSVNTMEPSEFRKLSEMKQMGRDNKITEVRLVIS